MRHGAARRRPRPRLASVAAIGGILALLVGTAFLADGAIDYRGQWFAAQGLAQISGYSLGGFLALLACAAFLADRAFYYRGQWFVVRGLARAPGYSLVRDEAVSMAADRWVLVGDSRFQRLPVPEQLGFDPDHGLRLINKAEGSAMAASVPKVFRSEVVALRPRGAIVQVGINDVMFALPERAQDAVLQAIVAFTAASRREGITPVISTIIPVSSRHLLLGSRMVPLVTSKIRAWNATVATINARLREYSRDTGVALLDLDRALTDETGHGLPEVFDADGVHLAQDGHRRVLGAILEFLSSRANAR